MAFLSSVSRTGLAVTATLGAVGCTGSPPDSPAPANAAATGELRPGMFRHGQLRHAASGEVSVAPPGAHLQYFGGRIVSNIQVVQVLWGTGNFLPQITSTASPSVATFYQGVLNSAYVDWLTEYNTIGLPPPASNQFLGRGAFSTQVQLTPSPQNSGATIDDLQIQAELSAQIAAGTLPAPSHDAAGNNNTYYAVFFPHGKLITLGSAASCTTFCAYHGTIADAGSHGEIEYGVHPDFQPGSGCEFGCGAATTPFGNVTQVASHELVETMTDPEVGLAPVFGPPLAWADLVFSEIGDICNDQNGQVVGSDGITYDVQTEFSNSVNDCIVTNPAATPLVVGSAGETCRGTTAMTSATVLGGAGRFTSDVTLSLASVGPTPPPGGEITASFDPDPVPTPPVTGATAAIRIASTPLTPPGSYTLTVQGQSAELTTTSTTTLVIRSQVPSGPSLSSPANAANGVPAAATFTWSAVDQASQYELDVFAGGDCGGAPIRAFTTGGTSFTLPDGQALDPFQAFAWHVTASNACGGGAGTTSSCFQFQTASCSEPQQLIANGGLEAGLASWTVELAVPPPVAGPANPHTGAAAVLLGSVTGPGEPLGDSQISQTLTLAAGSTPTLSFWEWPLTTDSVTFDQQYVRVIPISPPGAAVVLMNEARNDQQYVLRQFDLSPFAGKTVVLVFGVHQDGAGDFTGMFVDDISVSSINCGPPDFAIAVTPVTTGEVCAGASLLFTAQVSSVNGPNFTSPVTLTAGNLPPGATAVFADNPVPPGKATTLTLTTVRPTPGSQFTITVTGTAVTPPPDGTRTVSTAILVDPNTPDAPEIASPRIGEVNVPRRPTLAWTSPFVPELTAELEADAAPRAAPITVSQPGSFAWQLAATAPPGGSGGPGGSSAPAFAGATPRGPSSRAGAAATPFAFGAASYHLQVARDAGFTNLVVDVSVATTSFTLPGDLDIATQYFWRVTATNACGTSAFSTTGSFIVGACFEGWGQGPPVPITGGPSQSTVIASTVDNKIYLFGGGLGAGPIARIDQVWAFDPLTAVWTRKADIPPPGAGSTFGSGVQLGGTIYLFGGVIGPPGPINPHRALWRYNIAADTWSRGADLPIDNFGAAVAAIGGKIYLAYGSGFATQTWQYDPVTDSYTRKADAPALPQPVRVHAAVLAGELHGFGGGFEGNGHVIYNPASNTWRTGPAMPFTATDPAVGVLAGKAFVVGGRPTAHTQIFDPATGGWSQAAVITGAAGGVDNTAGAVLGPVFHLVGGFNGANGVNTHWQFHACNLGGLSSAALVPFVVDGNGKKPGIGNEASSLLIDNSVSSTPMAVSCFLYGTTGELLGSDVFQVAPNELRTVTDVVRALTHTTKLQNAIGSVALFGTEVFHTLASVVNNASGDPMYVDGQPIAGTTSGFVSNVGTPGNLTQTVFANASPTTSVVQVLAYPAAGGTTPIAGAVAFVPGHGQVSYLDVVKQLGLTASFTGQLSWTASQPIAVMARDTPKSKPTFSGGIPSHGLGDASSTAFVAYVEDTAAFATALELSNPGPITANVTVRFVDTADPTGATSGVDHTRDITVAINSGLPIADVVRWALRDTGTAPSGKHGFIVVTTPQAVTAQARLVDRTSLDPAVPDGQIALSGGFSPLLIRVESLPFAVADAAAAATPTTSRVALGNPGSAPVTVSIAAFNATGAAASAVPFALTLAPGGQFFTENLGAAIGLPPVFLGWLSIQATGPVLIYNHRRSGTAGGTIPVHAK